MHAESLARAQKVVDGTFKWKSLMLRISENSRILESSYLSIIGDIKTKKAITSAAEWLADNFHIVRSQLKDIKEHLSVEHYNGLPKILEGPLAGQPRVYGIAWAFVAHTDSNFNPELLKIFVNTYQGVEPLTIGELWALPITLRLVLIENLRRITVRIVDSQRARIHANEVADSLFSLGGARKLSVERVIKFLEKYPLNRSFAVQLLQRIRFHDTRVGLLHNYLDHRMAENGEGIESWVRLEHSEQSSDNISTRNIITSCRLISQIDWAIFFEEVSPVDKILREQTDFGKLDFTTRDRFRHKIENLAKNSNYSETQVAKLIIDNPGYHLIGDGQLKFEKLICYKNTAKQLGLRFCKKYPSAFYLGFLIFLSSLISLAFLFFLTPYRFSSWNGIFLFFPIILLSSEIAITLLNKLTISLLGPKHLPRFHLEEGIPSHLKTFIVVPTMFKSEDSIRAQLEQIEIHYLTNPDDNIYLALITDFCDSKLQIEENDELLLITASEELKLLNERYPVVLGSIPRFSIFHRRRVFNKNDMLWMGYERKRGKLAEFNSLLLGAKDTSFIHLPGQSELQLPPDIKYVITLDADTRLPRGTVIRLIGTMAHPLNKPLFDEKLGRVVSGYSILQPRVTPSLPLRQEDTLFRRLTAGVSGLDPYASAVSDVYQDLFNEGSYTGKGIYDLAMFTKCMKDRIEDNSVLSHDLLEGNFARCGYLSDVEFVEDFPSHVGVATQRMHRWIRGDWQLLPWIFTNKGSSLSLIGKWKMVDNLRRSLLPPVCLLLFFLTIGFLGQAAFPFMFLIFFSLLSPSILTLWSDLWPNHPVKRRLLHFYNCYDEFRFGISHVLLNLVLLPQSAWTSIDAISRALYRMFVSKKNLLQWTTAAQAEASASLKIKEFIKNMSGALCLILICIITLLIFKPKFYFITLSFLQIWLLLPWLAQRLSFPPRKNASGILSQENAYYFEEIARRTWRFFANFVNSESSHLPPDNYQIDPHPEIAFRSSPTNFGLYLLSLHAARDFGWIGIKELVKRMSATLKSLMALPKHQGHFYNWYNIKNQIPLEPRYISSVDNGNFVGHLITSLQACKEILKTPIQDLVTSYLGLNSTLKILEKELVNYKSNFLEFNQEFEDLFSAFRNLMARLEVSQKVQSGRTQDRQYLCKQAALLVNLAFSFATKPVHLDKLEILDWCRALQREIDGLTEDFTSLFSWSDYLEEKLHISLKEEDRNWWISICHRLKSPLTLEGADFAMLKIKDEISLYLTVNSVLSQDFTKTLTPLLVCINSSLIDIKKLRLEIEEIITNSIILLTEMDFKTLFDNERKLFSIGMNVAEQKLDISNYDLLASESRLTSFIAIAKGDTPSSHWYHLGRTLIAGRKQRKVLVSWSGSMFEYLMPNLVMKSLDGTLLDQTCRRIIKQHIDYGKLKSIPWGISESAYNKRDLHSIYQYSSFGVPSLALKIGLTEDLVVAPYATILAAQYEPNLAVENLKELERLSAKGAYGFFDAIDFTASRLPIGKKSIVVKNYMAHHQGMILVALANVCKKNIMQKRFHSDPMVQATELLLQERSPRTLGAMPISREITPSAITKDFIENDSRLNKSVNKPIPNTQLISNGKYLVMVNSAGSGFSRCKDLSVTRWREDVTLDNYGQYFYLKDCESEDSWSATYQPSCQDFEKYQTSFFEDRVQINSLYQGISSKLSICVSSEENAEIRRLTLTNESSQTREIEVTSYAEVVLNTQASDIAHPAFSNLFVHTEFNPELLCLIIHRRPRSTADKNVWLMHELCPDQSITGQVRYETSRLHFIGRGRSVRNPQAIFDQDRLSNSEGAVLDPIMSLQVRLKIKAGESANLSFVTGIAESRETLQMMAEKFHNPSCFTRTSDLSWTQNQIRLHHMGIEIDEAHLFQRLATRLIYSDPSLRGSSETLKENSLDVRGLWSLSLSGDHPIIVIKIYDQSERHLVRQLLKAQIYLATKGFISDLVILNEGGLSYSQDLQLMLEKMVAAAHAPNELHQDSGKVVVIRADLLARNTQVLLDSEAKVILSSRLGSLFEQLKRINVVSVHPIKPMLHPSNESNIEFNNPKLDFSNGLGGFTKAGDEYVITMKDKLYTPSPWINVIANPHFGFQVSESGASYTWAANSRENQLTPWSNDPVSDPSGETFYIFDSDSELLWSPTACPIRLSNTIYVTTHGQGYSKFSSQSYQISSVLEQFVLLDHPVKISRLTLENCSNKTKNLSITGYVEWVLGASRAVMAPTLFTEYDDFSDALLARNPRNQEHGAKIAFFSLLQSHSSYTCDRKEFIGRNSNLSQPRALLQNRGLAQRSGGGLDPCSALQRIVKLKEGEKIVLVFILGQSESYSRARDLISHVRKLDLDESLCEIKNYWKKILTKVQIETPDLSLDLMINRWQLYQTIACRLWARAAFYQAGGAYGFRDQLQDVMAIIDVAPEMAREQILLAASRQFIEGDVQHWWHPPSGRGVRTRFSDDLLWLPFVLFQYLQVSQDFQILDQDVAYLEGELLKVGQEDSYSCPQVSRNSSSLYEHCLRALNLSLKTGAHDLPLMGAGDWNDGMNRVGIDGKGESVWLAWFLITNLQNFSKIAGSRSDFTHQNLWRTHAENLKNSIEKNAWDGAWYKRAFFDDGSVLGSSDNTECRIDSIAQSWAVISGAAPKKRATQAMSSVYKYLVKPDEKIILLLTPPFDQMLPSPGYIKGYLPGVRENGGQYTHAAAWVVIASALLGENNRAQQLLSTLNPINHTETLAQVKRYKSEPYVISADVYSEFPHIGRGGWSWYTGAAGWLYRAGLEYILGFSISGSKATIKPCVPLEWRHFRISYHFKSTHYIFNVELGERAIVKAQEFTLVDDGKSHEVKVIF
jgi:cyclic beta-1,2-glucan synthetase